MRYVRGIGKRITISLIVIGSLWPISLLAKIIALWIRTWEGRNGIFKMWICWILGYGIAVLIISMGLHLLWNSLISFKNWLLYDTTAEYNVKLIKDKLARQERQAGSLSHIDQE